ncbi:MAG: M10 family metallopeptidase C-terminal domain-containing protein, partial [Allosphingosinicella sp.]
MPKFGQNNFSSRAFADSDSVAFGYDTFSRLAAADGAAQQMALDGASLGFTAFKSGIGFVADGLVAPVSSGLIIVGPDEAGDGIGVAPGNPTLTVDAASHTIGTIGIIGDQDYYAVTLVAGKSYEIGLFGYAGGPNGAPLQDSYLELYSAGGALVASADGGASTLPNQVNSGFDAVLSFDVTATGTYYINARAFDNNPTVGGSTGEGIGDYELYVHELNPNDPNIYHPYYDASSPLYAIDWGTQVNKINHTVRNPDGNEGTRSTSANGADPTDNPQGTPQYTSLVDIPALAAAQGVNITGKNVVTIYFAKQGDIFLSNDPTNPGLPPATITAVAVKDYEYTAVWTALGEFSKVADVVYLEVQDRSQADFIYTSYTGTPGPGVSLLGSMSPPGESDEGLAQFNSNDQRWNARDLAQGGFSFVTLIHEFGHGHGLAHPHDNGGHSGIMNGVEPEGAGVADYTTGDYQLNQSVYTMMSYEDGWQSSPYGNASTTAGYGYLGGLMAFDIAAIQDKYGVNEDTATGNDVYTLKDVNAAGTYFTSIWDGGGTDSIVYQGSKDATIDLRQATLKYEVGGGGFVSYAYGIFGGFTVANGVTIENASGGSGNDKLTGNAADNVLEGNAGNDNLYLWFGGGNDTALGGAGNDNIFFGGTLNSADIVRGGEGTDTLVLQGAYGALALTTNVTEIEGISMLGGGNTNFGESGTNLYDYVITTNDANFAAGLQVKINGAALLAGEDFTFDGSAETDAKFVVYG